MHGSDLGERSIPVQSDGINISASESRIGRLLTVLVRLRRREARQAFKSNDN